MAKTEKRNMTKVRIPKTSPDQADVFVSVNNDTYLIKRGVEVEVPEEVYEVLMHQEEMEMARWEAEERMRNISKTHD